MPNNAGAMAPMIPGYSGPRTLISVFPKELRLELRHEGFKTYVMPSAPKGKFSTLTVRDTYAWVRNFSADNFELYQAPIAGTVVAENLMQRWSMGLVGTRDGLGPGILVCAGLEPSPEEIVHAKNQQEAYFRELILEGDVLFAKPETAGDITDVHRMAAEWMGAQDRAWYKPIQHILMATCPACAEEIRSTAKICRFCRTNLADFIESEALKAKGVKAPKHELIG